MNNIEFFPSRISGRTVKAKEAKEVSDGGSYAAGGYSPSNDAVIVPASDTAFARTVRLHESLHAIHSRDCKLSPSDFVGQAIEDAKIHMLAKTTGQTRRDEVYTALLDVRNVTRAVKHGVTRDKALQGLALLRASSILRKSDSSKNGLATITKTIAKYHPQGLELVDSILAEISAGNIESARALTSLFMTGKKAEEMPQEGDGQEGDGQEGDGQEGDGQEGDGQEGEEKKQSTPMESKLKELPKETASKPAPSKSENGKGKPSATPSKPTLKAEREVAIPDAYKADTRKEYIPDTTKKAEKIYQMETELRDEEDGTVTVITGDDGTKPIKSSGYRTDKDTIIPYPSLWVHTLSPNASRKVKGKGRNSLKSATQGIKIRTNRLALNSLSPSGSRLFQTKNLGGTVLIDASGSMRVKDSLLYEIAEKIPAGKVAYYSGITDNEEPYGTDVDSLSQWGGHLVVYAQNGRIRKDRGDGRLPKRNGGNLIDYQAILWLLKQPAPRYLMTDKGFTGPSVTRNRAIEELSKAENKKQIIRFRSLDSLMGMIRKKK